MTAFQNGRDLPARKMSTRRSRVMSWHMYIILLGGNSVLQASIIYFENAAHVKEVPTTSFLWLIGVNNIFGTNDVICRLL